MEANDRLVGVRKVAWGSGSVFPRCATSHVTPGHVDKGTPKDAPESVPMQSENTLDNIILVDPVSSGFWLKQAAVDAGFAVVAVYTMSPDELKASGKDMPKSEKYRDCSEVIYAKTADNVLSSMATARSSIKA